MAARVCGLPAPQPPFQPFFPSTLSTRPQVDVYALGVILNECYTRRQPWRDSSHFFQIILKVGGWVGEGGDVLNGSADGVTGRAGAC